MTEPEESEEVKKVLANLKAARAERERLARLGRWSEADETVLVALRDVLTVGSPEISGPDLGGLIYVAGSPRPERKRMRGNWGPVPPERLSATYAMLLVNRGREPQTAIELARRAMENYGWRDLGAFWYCVLALAYAGELDEAQRHLDKAVARSGWSGLPPHISALTVLRARVAALGGDPLTAWQLLDSALKRGLFDQFTEVAVAWAITALVDLGDLDRAEDLLLSRGFGQTLDGVNDRAEVLAARGALRAATGRLQLAYDDFTLCGRQLAPWGVTNPAVIPWRSQGALCAATTDRRSLALSLANEELFHARRWGTPQTIGAALRAVALVSEDERADKLLEEAVEHLSHNGSLGALMRAQYELGTKWCLSGRREEGKTALWAARNAASRMKSDVWTKRIDKAIRRWAESELDEKPTGQELKVLNLALSGLSNKSIAAYLRLGTSTVEFHLSNAYRKLRISGRNELQSLMIPVW
ncbi:hypothetical protein GCM10027598_58290 [Amycolatopsis oliviviridis]|uniref:HTH luxR-type domain-containing protein n=1 Tax=Amycolatopsis oliviviridis TaxID=1471590 RepID=A0ABQ3M3E4_9PSEU|nr:helix-turn-helix transcriptional regulator [Amycolatopsis oliviviridis]GHH28310.1 hypothetical protein GCM10017790_58940 [Amycolatopsis oliviviridis]